MRDFGSLKIAIAGTGYVGLSLAVLLAQHHHVTAVDIIPEKVDLINNRKSPIQDDYIEKYLAEKNLNLIATLDGESAYKDADFVVIAAPTNYDSKRNFFDTSAVESVIDLVMKSNPDAVMVIKSTIPVGYTKSIRERTGSGNIIFSPEFLRESKALYDNLYPSRIVVGYRPGRLRTSSRPRSTFAAAAPGGRPRRRTSTTLFMGFHGGGGGEAVRQHVPGPPRQLLQRAGHLRGDPRASNTREPSSTACASIRASERTTTTRPSATAATACRRTPSSCWPTTRMCPRTLSRPLWSPTVTRKDFIADRVLRARRRLRPEQRLVRGQGA